LNPKPEFQPVYDQGFGIKNFKKDLTIIVIQNENLD